jgi:FkbM family methyltransferase
VKGLDHPFAVRLATGAKEQVRRRLTAAGYEVHRAREPVGHLDRRRRVLLTEVDLVLDVGANAGQYARRLRLAGFEGRIVSYEPNPLAHERLVAAAAGDAGWEARRLGLAGRAGCHVLHVSRNHQSSSVLAMLDRHVEAAPASAYYADETIRTTTLADVLASERRPGERSFVKLDTQGTELEILQGGAGLDGVVGVQVETSLAPLYEGQDLVEDVLAGLRAEGFVPIALEPGFADPTSGDLLQADVLAVRSER